MFTADVEAARAIEIPPVNRKSNNIRELVNRPRYPETTSGPNRNSEVIGQLASSWYGVCLDLTQSSGCL